MLSVLSCLVRSVVGPSLTDLAVPLDVNRWAKVADMTSADIEFSLGALPMRHRPNNDNPSIQRRRVGQKQFRIRLPRPRFDARLPLVKRRQCCACHGEDDARVRNDSASWMLRGMKQ